jgi:hypothetical protein
MNDLQDSLQRWSMFFGGLFPAGKYKQRSIKIPPDNYIRNVVEKQWFKNKWTTEFKYHLYKRYFEIMLKTNNKDLIVVYSFDSDQIIRKLAQDIIKEKK